MTRKRVVAVVAVGVTMLIVALFGRQSPAAITKEHFPLISYRPQAAVGLAFAWGNCNDFATLNITQRGGWYYRWWDSSYCPESAAEFVPMWGWPTQQSFYYGPEYRGYALFLNEPDRPDQNDLTPQEAAVKWVEFRVLCPYCRAIVLNVSRCDNTYYYSQWRTAVLTLTGSYPDIAGVGCHLYGTRVNMLAQIPVMVNWMESVGWGDKQLWISEFNRTWVTGGTQYSTTDLQAIINEFEHHPKITRYAFYAPRYCNTGSCGNGLFVGSSTTQLTANGQIYRDGATGYPGPSAGGPQPVIQESYP